MQITAAMSGGTAMNLPKARRSNPMSHSLPKLRCRPLDRLVRWRTVALIHDPSPVKLASHPSKRCAK